MNILGITRAISKKLVKISDGWVSSFLKTVPGCWGKQPQRRLGILFEPAQNVHELHHI